MSVPLVTRILLADDHTVVRHGLRMVLDAAPDLEVVAEAANGIEATERALREDIDLAVLDVAMPQRTGLQAARELIRRRPELRILMLSMHDLEDYCFEALKAGASGYVLKTVADRELVEACRATMRGEPFLSPPTVRALMRAYLADPGSAPEKSLTPREREVVKLVAEAHPTTAAASPSRHLTIGVGSGRATLVSARAAAMGSTPHSPREPSPMTSDPTAAATRDWACPSSWDRGTEAAGRGARREAARRFVWAPL